MTVPDLDVPDFAPFWRGCRAGRLLVRRCERGHLSWPPRPACPRCHGPVRDWQEVGGWGSLYSWTVVHRTPMPEFRPLTPYAVGVVELAEQPGLRMLGRCRCDLQQLRIGLLLQVVFERVSDEFHVPVWQEGQR